jgi:hypothetical protein
VTVRSEDARRGTSRIEETRVQYWSPQLLRRHQQRSSLLNDAAFLLNLELDAWTTAKQMKELGLTGMDR